MSNSHQKKNKVSRHSENEMKQLKGKTDFKKLDAMSDRDIDFSDIPEFNGDVWATAEIVDHTKKAISLRVDSDVLDWFKHRNGRYQTLMNKVLRRYMESQLYK